MADTNRPILCIVPGWGGSRETWTEFIVKAEKTYEVHCIELPCFGGVPCPQTVWGVEQYSEYVFHQIRELKQEKPEKKIILLGHSFGGQVATYVAERHGDIVDGLVLIAAAVVRPRRILKRAIFGMCTRIGKFILRTRQNNTTISEMKKKIYTAIFSPDYMEASGIKREIFRKVIREDLREILPKITKKVLIFWGKKDTYTPLSHGKIIAKKLKNSELIVFKDGRHGLHHTHADRILTTLKERYTTL